MISVRDSLDGLASQALLLARCLPTRRPVGCSAHQEPNCQEARTVSLSPSAVPTRSRLHGGLLKRSQKNVGPVTRFNCPPSLSESASKPSSFSSAPHWQADLRHTVTVTDRHGTSGLRAPATELNYWQARAPPGRA